MVVVFQLHFFLHLVVDARINRELNLTFNFLYELKDVRKFSKELRIFLKAIHKPDRIFRNIQKPDYGNITHIDKKNLLLII